MKDRFFCLSTAYSGGLIGGFTRDKRDRGMVIRCGDIVYSRVVTDLESAASVFAERLARRTYGRCIKVWGPGIDGYCSDPNSKIYKATIASVSGSEVKQVSEIRFVVRHQC